MRLTQESAIYVDTHCHLDLIISRLGLPGFDDLRRTHFPADWDGCVHVACDPPNLQTGLELLENPGVYGAFGIHPHEARHWNASLENGIRAAMEHPKTVAWGETGLDYHYDHSPRSVQRRVFRKQLDLARQAEKPVVVHSREAETDTLAVLADALPGEWPIHVHCFTGTARAADALLGRFGNLYLGFTGVVTFANATSVREAVLRTPSNRLLLETDGPFLAPVPQRGRTCHSGHIPLIAAELAKVRGESIEDVYVSARENTRRLYGI